MTTVIAGFGNELRADDGVGLAVIRHIERVGVPDGVRCAEMGIGGIAMLHELFAGCERLVIVDAVRPRRHARHRLRAVAKARRRDGA